MMLFRKSKTPQIKKQARRTLSRKFTKDRKNYVIDTSAIIMKFVSSLVKKGLQGKIIIPNAVMVELENLANKGKEEGFKGLEEVAGFHKLKKIFPIQIFFQGPRPNDMQIRHAKSGEIDSLIRETARSNKAILITADLVQAKTAQAYNIEVIFLKPKEEKKKKSGFWFLKR